EVDAQAERESRVAVLRGDVVVDVNGVVEAGVRQRAAYRAEQFSVDANAALRVVGVREHLFQTADFIRVDVRVVPHADGIDVQIRVRIHTAGDVFFVSGIPPRLYLVLKEPRNAARLSEGRQQGGREADHQPLAAAGHPK